jgi:signal transduction histidine kinase
MNFSFSSRRFWTRLGNPNALGAGLFAFALAFIALLSFAFDVVRLGNYTWLWVPANALGVLIASILLLPAVVLKRRLNAAQTPQPWFNISISSLFFGIKNLSMLYVSPLFGISDQGDPAFRFIGGVFLGMSLLVLFTNVAGNRLQRESNLARLQAVEAELLSFREAALEELEDETREASLNTFSVLAPQLEKLQVAVKQSKDIVSLASQIIEFIRSELKPFDESLTQEALNLSKSPAAKPPDRVEPEIRVDLSKSLRIWNSFVPLPMVMFFTAIFTVPSATFLDIVGMCVAFVATLSIIKVATLKMRSLSVLQAFIATTVIAYFAGLPGFLLIYQIPNNSGIPELLPTFLVMQGWSVIAASQAHILDLGQSSVEDELNVAIAELARENKLFEQKAWLARHGWYLIVHGVVQPALTSASMRASASEEITPQVKDKILSDLQRALDALKDSRSAQHSADVSITEIKSVWSGICDIHVFFTPFANQVLKNDQVASDILNEILKEVISNAVRHGNASNIHGEISMKDSKTISVVISNDGLKPTKEKIESVGSKMLDAVCLERTLEWNSEEKRTDFKALVPIKN